MTSARRSLPFVLLASAVAACAPATTDDVVQAAESGVEISPPAPEVFPEGTVTFAAVVGGSTVAVTWSIQEAGGGSVTANGLYTAPAATGQYHVVATTATSPAVTGTATVTVTEAPVVQVTITPRTPAVLTGGTVSFAAAVTGATNTSVTWTVSETSGCGAISSSGVYTAPGTPGTCHVVATSVADPTKSDTVAVTVSAPPAVVVTVAPHTASVAANAQRTFTATVSNATDTSVAWSVAEATGCGAITSGGVYTAPGTAGTCHVVATSVADGTKSDTATVTVTPPAAVAVTISPKTRSVAVGGQITFSATVANATNTAVTWTVTETSGCGAITSGGVYTAPGTAGTCHVVATSVADGTKSDTATVTVTTAPADLAAQLAVLSGKAIYLGRQSVGGNIMTGVRALLAANSGPEPTVVNTYSAASMGPGIWAESSNGTNFDPISKINAFRDKIQGGVGAKVNIAMVKFCWVDFDTGSLWFQGGGTAAGLFAEYQSALAALRSAYPAVTFVHFTAPIYRDNTSRNAVREQYNALVRSTYGGAEPVFDLALHESTDPSGNRVILSNGPALYSGYTDDGGHLNATGQDVIARKLVAYLATLP